ncbi:MAG: tripartite tricarboxylate transporter substrate binding protein [Betaproteobacteria bacterium]|nr:tripartite tricarboxylate transporter substrate binding protein [Betaproteobacteria bacterium]
MRLYPRLVCTLLAIGAAAAECVGQTYPTRPLRMLVGYAPGGGTDIIARLMALHLQPRLGQPVIVENRPGAGGNIASEQTARAVPDGYTILMAANTIAINPFLSSNKTFDVATELTGVALICNSPILVVVNPSLPVHTIAELIAHAKANPGRLSYGTPGIGTPQHLATELFQSMTKTTLVHIPYKGGAQAVADVAGGQLQLSFAATSSAAPLVQAGRLRALATGGAQRAETVKDVPTVGETVSGYNVGIWYGIMAPANMPRAAIERLHHELAAIVAMPEVQERMFAQGFEHAVSTPEAMTRLVRDDLAKWERVVREAGIKPE